jgi:hypothetical protein
MDYGLSQRRAEFDELRSAEMDCSRRKLTCTINVSDPFSFLLATNPLRHPYTEIFCSSVLSFISQFNLLTYCVFFISMMRGVFSEYLCKYKENTALHRYKDQLVNAV